MRFLLLSLLLISPALAQTQIATTGLPSPTLSGAGVPSLPCNANLASVLDIQTDAPTGQKLWLCNGATSTWENIRGPLAVANTPAMSISTLTLGQCVTSNVTIAGATVGANAAFASPLGAPTSNSSTAGLVNVTAFVSAANTITVSECASGLTAILGSLTTAAVPFKVQLY